MYICALPLQHISDWDIPLDDADDETGNPITWKTIAEDYVGGRDTPKVRAWHRVATEKYIVKVDHMIRVATGAGLDAFVDHEFDPDEHDIDPAR